MFLKLVDERIREMLRSVQVNKAEVWFNLRVKKRKTQAIGFSS
jgi:hypothetical protein